MTLTPVKYLSPSQGSQPMMLAESQPARRGHDAWLRTSCACRRCAGDGRRGWPTFTLANGIVTAKVSKRSGDLVSLKYKELELLTGSPATPAATGRTTPSGRARRSTPSPSTRRPTTASAAKSPSRRSPTAAAWATGPAAAQSPTSKSATPSAAAIPASTPIRSSTHKPDYPATSIGEAPFLRPSSTARSSTA